MITDKMIPAFQQTQGGLFSKVEKADVGDIAEKLSSGIAFLSWADPFYPNASTPAHVAQAMIDSINDGSAGHYTMPIGNPELKRELAKKLKRFNGLDVVPERNILVTPGSDSALFYAMLPFIHDGDEVMIIDPSYPNNFQNTEILGGKVVRIPVYEEDGYQFNIEAFESRLTPKTKMVVLTNPNNPTTVSYRRRNMEQLAEFIVRNDLVLVVDQAFEEPVFDGVEMVTAAALPGMWERTVSVFSVSKVLGLSGLRVGYIVADDHIIDKLYGAAVTVLGATNTAAQLGAVVALQDPAFSEDFYKHFDKRRHLVYDYLHDIPGVSMRLSESGFLSWLDVSELGTEQEVSDYLLKNAKVALNIGTPYGHEGRGHLRIVQGAIGSDEEIENVLARMRGALLELSKSRGLC